MQLGMALSDSMLRATSSKQEIADLHKPWARQSLASLHPHMVSLATAAEVAVKSCTHWSKKGYDRESSDQITAS